MRERFQETLAAVWRGEMENDRFNRLVLRAGLRGRDVTVLRAYVKYLRQVGHDVQPRLHGRDARRQPGCRGRLVTCSPSGSIPTSTATPTAAWSPSTRRRHRGLHRPVESLNEDRVLRSLLRLVAATLRTNYFLTPAERRGPPGSR